jgi:hypothetical protein
MVTLSICLTKWREKRRLGNAKLTRVQDAVEEAGRRWTNEGEGDRRHDVIRDRDSETELSWRGGDVVN